MIEEFKSYLSETNLSANTQSAYLISIKKYQSLFGETVNKDKLKKYKLHLIENYKPKTVNLRIRAINAFLKSVNKEKLNLSFVKLQQKTYINNIISNADYEYFKKCLKNDGKMLWYFVIRFMAATGARVSELVMIKVEHVKIGYIDLYTKGGKIRRLYIPISLRNECSKWLAENGITSGFIFLNRYGKKMTTRGISGQLKTYALKYGLESKVIYPHSFRHRFAKSFLEKYNDIALLADLMGHENIETTRIYLRKTSAEQQFIVDKYVDW